MERWRELLHVRDVDHHDTPLHRVCRFGHRLQLARLMLQHAPRYRRWSHSRCEPSGVAI